MEMRRPLHICLVLALLIAVRAQSENRRSYSYSYDRGSSDGRALSGTREVRYGDRVSSVASGGPSATYTIRRSSHSRRTTSDGSAVNYPASGETRTSRRYVVRETGRGEPHSSASTSYVRRDPRIGGDDVVGGPEINYLNQHTEINRDNPGEFTAGGSVPSGSSSDGYTMRDYSVSETGTSGSSSDRYASRGTSSGGSMAPENTPGRYTTGTSSSSTRIFGVSGNGTQTSDSSIGARTSGSSGGTRTSGRSSGTRTSGSSSGARTSGGSSRYYTSGGTHVAGTVPGSSSSGRRTTHGSNSAYSDMRGVELGRLISAAVNVELEDIRHQLSVSHSVQQRTERLLAQVSQSLGQLATRCTATGSSRTSGSSTAENGQPSEGQLEYWMNQMNEYIRQERSTCTNIQTDIHGLDQKVDYVTQLFSRYHREEGGEHGTHGGQDSRGSSSAGTVANEARRGEAQAGSTATSTGSNDQSSSGRQVTSGSSGGGTGSYSYSTRYTSSSSGGTGGGTRHTSTSGTSSGGPLTTSTGSSGGTRHTSGSSGSSSSSGSHYAGSSSSGSVGSSSGSWYPREHTSTGSGSGSRHSASSSQHSGSSSAASSGSQHSGASNSGDSASGSLNSSSSSQHSGGSTTGSSGSAAGSLYSGGSTHSNQDGSYSSSNHGAGASSGSSNYGESQVGQDIDNPNIPRYGVDYNWRYPNYTDLVVPNSGNTGDRESTVNIESHGEEQVPTGGDDGRNHSSSSSRRTQSRPSGGTGSSHRYSSGSSTSYGSSTGGGQSGYTHREVEEPGLLENSRSHTSSSQRRTSSTSRRSSSRSGSRSRGAGVDGSVADHLSDQSTGYSDHGYYDNDLTGSGGTQWMDMTDTRPHAQRQSRHQHRHQKVSKRHDDDVSNEVTYDTSTSTRVSYKSTFTPAYGYGICPAFVNGIGSEEEVRSDVAVVMGTWMRDAGLDDHKVWSIQGSNAMHWKTLMEYRSMDDYKERLNSGYHTLNETCTGLGAVVYKDHVYCQAYSHRRKSMTILKISLESDRVVGRAVLSRYKIERSGVPYRGWAGIYLHSQILVDEKGMWVLAGEESSRRLLIYSLDPRNLQVLHTIRTARTKDSVGPAFMSCGVMYALDSTYANHVSYIYDTSTGLDLELETHDLPFPSMDLAALQYSPFEQQLYVWQVTREQLEEQRPGRRSSRVYGISQRIPLIQNTQSKFDFFE